MMSTKAYYMPDPAKNYENDSTYCCPHSTCSSTYSTYL